MRSLTNAFYGFPLFFSLILDLDGEQICAMKDKYDQDNLLKCNHRIQLQMKGNERKNKCKCDIIKNIDRFWLLVNLNEEKTKMPITFCIDDDFPYVPTLFQFKISF